MTRHLAKIGKTYYFRLVIPTDLKPFFTCTELKHSLKCRSKKLAYSQVASYEQHYQLLFAQLRLLSMPAPKISKQAIELWLKQNPGKSFIPPELKNHTRIGSGLTGNPVLNDSTTVMQTLLGYGYVPDDNGKFDTSVPPANYPATVEPLAAAPEPIPIITTTPKQPKSKQIKLSAVIPEFLEFKSTNSYGQTAIAAGSLVQYRGHLRKFSVFTGDCSLHTALSKISDYTLAMYNSGNVKTGTINDHIKTLKVFVDYCVKQKLIDKDLVGKIERAANHGDDDTGNKPYTIEQMQAIIDYLCTHNKAGVITKRETYLTFVYAVLLCMCTGNRIEEVLQLQQSDIIFENGFNCLSFRETGTKTTAASRIVPIAKTIKDLYFMTYLQKIKNKDKIFNHYTTYIGALNFVLETLKIKSKRNEYGFHSYRHNVYTSLGTLECSEIVRDNLIGHEHKGMGRTYAHPDSERLAVMDKYLSQLNTKIDFSKMKQFLKSEIEYLYR